MELTPQQLLDRIADLATTLDVARDQRDTAQEALNRSSMALARIEEALFGTVWHRSVDEMVAAIQDLQRIADSRIQGMVPLDASDEGEPGGITL